MGLQNRHWSDCTATEKETLGTRFDFLKTKRTLIKARKVQILNALLTN